MEIPKQVKKDYPCEAIQEFEIIVNKSYATFKCKINHLFLNSKNDEMVYITLSDNEQFKLKNLNTVPFVTSELIPVNKGGGSTELKIDSISLSNIEVGQRVRVNIIEIHKEIPNIPPNLSLKEIKDDYKAEALFKIFIDPKINPQSNDAITSWINRMEDERKNKLISKLIQKEEKMENR